jgi:ABC-2 type transport system permease protein
MSVLEIPTTAHRTPPKRIRRTRSLGIAETRLLLRNRTAVVNSVLLPLLLVAAVPLLGSAPDLALGPRLLVTAVGVTLVFLTYYNLVATYVARREDLVLQRMRTGELTEGEVLLGTATPTLLVTALQLVLVSAGVVVLGEWVSPADAILPLIAVFGGAALMMLLAMASTAFTRTVESAQITTLPLLVAATGLSGLFFPLSVLPDGLAEAARFLPLTPVIELAQLGLAGVAWDGTAITGAGPIWTAAMLPLAVLAGWLILASVVAPRVFRWAPRR